MTFEERVHDAQMEIDLADAQRWRKLQILAHRTPTGQRVVIAPAGIMRLDVAEALNDWIDRLEIS